MNIRTLSEHNRLPGLSLKVAGVTLANIAITVLNIVAGVAVARYLDLATYGELSYFINIFGSLRLLGSLGLTSQVSFALSQARGRGDPAASIFWQLLSLRTITLMVFLLGLGVIAALGSDMPLLIAGGTAILALLNDFGIGALQGLGRVRQAVVALLIQPAIYTAGLLAIMLSSQPIIVLYLIFAGSFIPPILLAVVALIGALPRGRHRSSVSFSIGTALRFAGGMYGLALCGTLFTSFATLYLGAMGKFADTALITIPLNIIFMPGALVNMVVSTVYFPRLSHADAQRNVSQVHALFQEFATGIAGVGLLVATNLLLYPQTLLTLLYGSRYLASAPLLSLLAVVAFAYPLQSLITTTLAAQGRLRAALGYVGFSTLLLLTGVTLAAHYSADLRLIALAHVLAVVPVLGWQLRTVGYPLKRTLRAIGGSVCVLFVLGGAARMFVPDTLDNRPAALLALSAITLLYGVWLSRVLLRDGN